ncbi:MAG: cobalamin biosynthesis protein, partial [Proteobacteria bacterium]|nr:cobalamin biosynthesis protein [Pseudomonadota bacterium]
MSFWAALLLEWACGDPRSSRHPVALFGRYAAWIESRCYAATRGAGARAWIATVLPIGLALFAAWECVRWFSPTLGTVVGALLLWASLGWRSLLEHVRAVARAPDLAEARAQVAQIVGRRVETLDAA